MRIGQRYILVAHAHDGRVEVVEAMLHRDHREFAGDRADRPAFLDDDEMVRLLEAGEHRRGVERAEDRKSGVEGKSVSVRVDLGGRRIIKKTKKSNIFNNDYRKTPTKK